MEILEIKELLQGRFSVLPEDEHHIIENFIATDLMSDVLVTEEENIGIITSLTTEQVIRTADIVAASLIILTNDKEPQPGLVTLAKECEIPVLSTPLPTFEACAAINRLQEDHK